MTGDPLDRIARWGEGLVASEIGWGRDVLALVEVARAAREVTEHHFDTCDLVLGLSSAYPCSCGIDALRAALARLDGPR